MVIEHSFVTTIDAPETMRLATEFLQARGFENARPVAFQLGEQQWNGIEMRRGKTNAGRAKNIAQLPQTLRLDFDRGRVGLALSITPSSEWGGASGGVSPVLMFGLLGLLISRSWSDTGNPKKMRLHQEMMIAIATGLEQLLVQRRPMPEAAAELDRVEAEIVEVARNRSRRNLITLIVFLVIMLAMVAFVFVATSKHW